MTLSKNYPEENKWETFSPQTFTCPVPGLTHRGFAQIPTDAGGLCHLRALPRRKNISLVKARDNPK